VLDPQPSKEKKKTEKRRCDKQKQPVNVLWKDEGARAKGPLIREFVSEPAEEQGEMGKKKARGKGGTGKDPHLLGG